MGYCDGGRNNVDVHFTLWPSLTQSEGGHTEIDWPSFVAFVANPAIAADKKALEGWSPARFTGNRRRASACEFVSAIVLDDDASGASLPRLREIWAGVAGVVHSSHSATEAAPKWRVVLRTSRDMTPAEHARVWAAVRDVAAARGQVVDEATKDPSRLWFVPARKPDAPYGWTELEGLPLDVDTILAAVPAEQITKGGPDMVRPRESGAANAEHSTPAVSRKHAMAVALGAAWPAKGRHEAQLALAGALRAEGWAAEDAVEFLCTVTRTAGNEDRAKREATVRHTWGKPEGAQLTGWTRLKSFVDPVVVDVVRKGVGSGADFDAKIAQRLEQAASTAPTTFTEVFGAAAPPADAGAFKWKSGGFDAPLPPLTYSIDGLICKGDVVMLVAHGNSLKTWLAFSIALSIATGRPWLSQFGARRGKAAILDFESGDYEVVRRLKLLGAKDAETAGLLRSSYSGANLADFETWIGLAGLGLELLVVDSFSAAAPDSDENDKRAAVMLQHAGTFANATGCTVIFIHHARKDTGGDQRMNVRGSTALFAACDRIFEFVDLEKKDGGIVLTTMRSIKDGAGKAPPPVRVELSDSGLHFVKEEPKAAEDDEDSTEKKNRALVFEILKNNSAGVPKTHLVNVMKGKRERKFELLSALALAGLVVEIKDKSGVFVMLRPGTAL